MQTNKDDNPVESLKNAFYPIREKKPYKSYNCRENEDLLAISLDLKERRKMSTEGILYLGEKGRDNLDYLLNGDIGLLEKEKEKYLNYIICKHGKCFPKEILQNKLTIPHIRKIKRLKEDKGKKPDEHEDDNNSLPNPDSPIPVEESSDSEVVEDYEGFEEDDRISADKGEEREFD